MIVSLPDWLLLRVHRTAIAQTVRPDLNGVHGTGRMVLDRLFDVISTTVQFVFFL